MYMLNATISDYDNIMHNSDMARIIIHTQSPPSCAVRSCVYTRHITIYRNVVEVERTKAQTILNHVQMEDEWSTSLENAVQNDQS